jgi:hypothetical protein
MKRIISVLTVAVLAAACGGGSDDLGGPSGSTGANPSQTGSCTLPSRPTNLTAAALGTGATLTWSPSNGATEYLVLVGTSPSSSDTLLTNTTQTQYSWTGIRPGRHYARVQGKNACGTSASSNEAEFTIAE